MAMTDENIRVELNRLDKDMVDTNKRIDHIEYDDIKGINQEINNVKIELNTNNLLVKQATETNRSLALTMDSMKSAMVELAQSIKSQNETSLKQTEVISKLSEKLNVVDSKVNSVETKVNNVETKVDNVESKFDDVDDEIQRVDNKSKIDITETQTSSIKSFLTKYGGYIVGGGGLVAIIVELVQKLS